MIDQDIFIITLNGGKQDPLKTPKSRQKGVPRTQKTGKDKKIGYERVMSIEFTSSVNIFLQRDIEERDMGFDAGLSMGFPI